MQRSNFDQVVQEIVQKDTRYDIHAYRFVREGLDYTLKSLKRSASTSNQRHVSGPELLDGIRHYTLREFGPMSKLVLNEWGVSTCQDFGQIVFNLVQHGVLGKSESDKLEDFSETFTFDEAFVKPFLPLRAPIKDRKKKPAIRASRVKPGSNKSIPSSSASE